MIDLDDDDAPWPAPGQVMQAILDQFDLDDTRDLCRCPARLSSTISGDVAVGLPATAADQTNVGKVQMPATHLGAARPLSRTRRSASCSTPLSGAGRTSRQ